jgi:hypothetical protein
MIRTKGHLVCFLLGAIFVAADGAHWWWATLALAVAVPWDILSDELAPMLGQWYTWRRDRRMEKITRRFFRKVQT